MLNNAINSNQNINIAIINEAVKNFSAYQKNLPTDEKTRAPLKRTLNSEEIIKLIGNEKQAKILSQLLFLSKNRYDFQEFLTEETRRRDSATASDVFYGWIALSGEELAQQTLSTDNEDTLRRHAIKLVDKKYLFERNNPYDKWIRKKQYRINLRKIVKDLDKLGYYLPDYTVPKSLIPTIPQNEISIPQYAAPIPQFIGSIPQFAESLQDCNIKIVFKSTYLDLTTTQISDFDETEDVVVHEDNQETPTAVSDLSPPPIETPQEECHQHQCHDELVFDHALDYLSETEKEAIRKSLNGCERPQELLDELNSAVIAGSVKKSRIGFLMALIRRKAKGEFNPTSELAKQRAKAKGQSTLGNAISQCLLCDDNGILTLMTPQGTTTTTRCGHNAEEIQSIAKERGFEVIPHKKA